MEISGTGVSEDRIAALEKRLREMDALVKGLLDELLDFRAVAMTLSRQAAEDRRQELGRGRLCEAPDLRWLVGLQPPPMASP